MTHVGGKRVSKSLLAGVTVGILFVLATAALAARAALTLVSSDPYVNTTSYHATEVEPDTFSSGKTIVAAFQVGRFPNGGASNIGWGTSTDGGATWHHGFLPGTTVYATPKGRMPAISDPAAAYDAKHNVWLISSLGLAGNNEVVVSRSADGGLTWTNPVTVSTATAAQAYDKDWITCDDTPTSPHFGSCYVQWDDFGAANGGQLKMAFSRDGGKTWSMSAVPSAGVIGGQPVVQPNGHVVMPIEDSAGAVVESFMSTNGGVSYTGPARIATITSHGEAGNLRSANLVSAEVDKAGKVYVVWSDCRFRAGCAENDIVLSTSTDGTHWTAVKRIPIDATTTTVDHFLPGIGAARDTSGATAKLGLTYYYYPNTNCTQATCQLDVGFVKSSDGGATWTAPVQLAGPSKMNQLANTSQGFMVGDYVSTSLLTGAGDKALSVFAVGMPVAGKTCTLGQVTSCNEPMEAPATGLTAAGATRRTVSDPVLSTHSDHALAFGRTLH